MLACRGGIDGYKDLMAGGLQPRNGSAFCSPASNLGKKSRNLRHNSRDYWIAVFAAVLPTRGMKRDSKPPVLTAVVPTWAQEPRIAPLRPLKTSLSDGSSASSVSATPALLRMIEAAAILQVSSKTVRRLLARGDLRAVRIGRSVRIHSAELDNLIAGGGARVGGSGGGDDDL